MDMPDSTQPVAWTSRRAIVTGAGSGIGAATTAALRALGAAVVAADIDADSASATAERTGATAVRLDVGDSAAWTRVVDEHGPFDIAVLNAGIATNQLRPDDTLPVLGLDDERYRRIMSVNVDGVVLGSRAVLDHMVGTGFGDIVVTASIAGLVPIAPDPVYGLTKHAVVGFVRSLAAAVDTHTEPLDVTISAVCPGFADTAIIDADTKDRITGNGIELLTPEAVADVMIRALTERRNGAQWVLWPGLDAAEYSWNDPIAGLLPPGLGGDG
jgi:NAD(P)-dependent dehydrogenase (short-subunit alcohol dehydrogenase family)